jgi:N-acetylglucosaminyldiphosphoundecaprenol N-acetyl-beta-D-mannosaminyltransferase
MTTLNSQPFVQNHSEPNDAHRTSLLGMPLNAVTEIQALQFIEERLDKKRGTWVLTPNLDILRHYFTKPELRPLFHANEGGADLLVADGMPLVWASHLTGHAVPERVPGSGLVLSLAKRAAAKGWSIYLLGGSEGAADKASQVLQQKYPGLKIAGTCCPAPGFEKDPEQLSAIRNQLRAANPDIVYVALGFPKQEIVTKYLRPALPAATFIGVGISLSFIAGEVRRAPRLVQRMGLEWLHRLVQEPRRLARRYLVQDMPFALFHLLPGAVAERWQRSEDRPAARPGHFPEVPPSSRARDWPNSSAGSKGSPDEGRHSRRRPGHSPQSSH